MTTTEKEMLDLEAVIAATSGRQKRKVAPQPSPSPESAAEPVASPGDGRPGRGRPFSGRVTLTCRPLAATADKIARMALENGKKPGQILDELLDPY